MTIIDDISREPFTPTLVDASLEHQLQLTWASRSRRETVARCNCGWVGTRRRPEVFGSVQGTIAEYEGHLAATE